MRNLSEYGTGNGPASLAEFRPAAKYFAAMDCLIYLREDCSYRAVRLDSLRTVLLHPTEDRAVGVKLKGTRFLMERLMAIFKSHGVPTTELSKHLKLITLWETAATAEGADAIEFAEAERHRQYRERARELVQEAASLPPDELPVSLAA